MYLVEEKVQKRKLEVQKSQVSAQYTNLAPFLIGAGAHPTGQYRPIFQVRNLMISEIKGLS